MLFLLLEYFSLEVAYIIITVLDLYLFGIFINMIKYLKARDIKRNNIKQIFNTKT